MSTTPHTKGLRKAMGALSLGFMMVAGCSNTATTPAPVKISAQAPQQKSSPLPSTKTTASTMMADIEQQANAYIKTIPNPPPHIAILDFDEINTFIGSNGVASKLHLYLQQRGLDLVPKYNLPKGTLMVGESGIYTAMGGNAGPARNFPQRHITTTNDITKIPDACIIIPQLSDLSSRSILEKWIGEAAPRHLLPTIDPGPYQMAKRATWHEVWHCLDHEFVQAQDRVEKDHGFESALAEHRAEMFADVAATLTMASQGNLEIIKDTADARAVSSRWIGPRSMEKPGSGGYSPKTDSDYYSGVTYYTTPAHDAALAYINRVGLNTIKTYTLADIQRVATDLTHQSALNAEQFQAVSDYLKQGDSYLAAQNQKAATGNAEAKRNADLIIAYQSRTAAAKSRITAETTLPSRPEDPNYIAPDMEDVLLSASKQEKLEVYTAMETSVTTALRNSQTPRQGVLNQLEAWRKQLHTARDRRPDLEQKLYLAALMLSNGYMDPLLKPATPNAAPKPSP